MSFICKSCNRKSNYITDLSSGEILCPHCGIVVIEKFSESADYGKNGYVLDFASSNSEPVNYTMADLGLSSVMDQSGRDAHGAALSSNSKESFRRLAVWDKKSRSKQSKGMHIPLTVLQNIASNLGLPNTVEEDIAYQFRKCVSLGIHKKIGRKKLVPVIVYITCRKLNIPRTLQDVADASNVSKRILRRNYSKTILELGLNPELVRPSTLIPRIATSIGLKEKVSRFAVLIASQYENTRYSLGKNPCGIAGACVYLSCTKFGIEIPQVEICNIAGTSSVTIRNVSKSIRLALPHLIIVQRVTNKKLR